MVQETASEFGSPVRNVGNDLEAEELVEVRREG